MTNDTPTAGEALARYRYRLNMTQEELAERAGVSKSMVKAIEQGTRTGSMPTLNKLARALNITTTDLLIPSRTVKVAPDASPDELLAVRRALTPPLFGASVADTPGDPAAWRDTLAYAERLYRDDNYAAALAAVPVLLDEARSLDTPRPLAQAYLYAAQTLTQVRQLDLANHALVEAARAAHDLSDELLAAWASSIQCWTLIRQARFSEVEHLAVSTAELIEPRLSEPASPKLATWGWLMIRAASAAIRDARPDDAEEYMRAARAAASRLGTEAGKVAKWMPPPVRGFCETTVGYKDAENAVLLEEHGKALEISSRLAPSKVPTSNNRDRHKLDLAASHLAQHQAGDAIETLLDLRQASPQWLKHQRYAKDIVRQLVHDRKRAYAEQVGVLADHVGVTV
ncbi:helix-turn-helix domain-containing protein [Kribbella deserti]|uniref:Helix-turn-helix domain-containing protein n=1 Tax=Kribbella deserti TaxID=1926257 RepID=A0ABV6QF25_9ACTN